MNLHFTSPKQRRQAVPARILWILLLALLASIAPGALSAQGSDVPEKGILTLLPTGVETENLAACRSQPIAADSRPLTISADFQGNPVCSILLHFRSDVLPDGAIISAARLNLVAQTSSSAAQTITVYKLPFDAAFGDGSAAQTDAVFGDTSLERDWLSAGQRAEWQANSASRQAINKVDWIVNGFSLRLTTRKGQGRQWYSDQAQESSLRPRLIVEYMVDGQGAANQSNGMPAAPSQRGFLPVGTRASSDTEQMYTSIPFPEAWSFTPAFYRNWVYQIIDNQLQSFSPIGNPVGTPVPLNNPGQHLLISQTGRVYIVGNERILTIQLDSQGQPGGDVREIDVPGLNPGIPPTLGSDGSLYFVNGMEVYGRNPDLQEVWKVTLSDTANSRVTVGPSGQFVYLVAKKEGLVAINGQTGEKVAISSIATQAVLTSTLTLTSTLNLTFHALLVVRHPDGSEIIYAAANSAERGVLAKFDNSRTKAGARDTGTIQAASAWGPLTGLWSQPILDQLPPGVGANAATPNPDKKVYAVKVAEGKATPYSIDWLSGEAVAIGAPFAVEDRANLLTSGTLALDGAGTLFVWNGAGSDSGLYAYGEGSAGRLAAAASDLSAESQLFFGTEGTLYAVDGVGRVLRAIVPQYTLGSGAGAGIYSPTQLAVTGVVTQSTTLAAGGGLFLGRGFRVQFPEGEGSVLRISVGVPPE